jgi:asparagine synthase (glutamine-hydrolysing)
MPRPQAEAQLSQMVAALKHEPFYTTGTFVDESLGVYVGWALQQGSFSAGAPYKNERGDVCLVFSGEDYPQPGTVQRLKQQGHELKGGGASYLVHVYEDNPDFPVQLNGMFHGLLVDERSRKATLFNDRYGMHRVYYHECSDGFYFGAEAKAILAVRPELRTPDAQGIGELVACSCVLEDRTIFKGIRVLPAGSAWMFANGSIERKESYFQPDAWENQAPLDSESYYRELRDVFSHNLPRYFNGNQQIGIALTGGLDTRTIMAWHKPAANTLPCYTFGGMFRECEDVRVARQIAKACQQTHQVIPVGKEFLSQFPQYAERAVYLTEGGVDVYRSSDLYVSQRARLIAPVKVVGTYGSEILRQAVMFKPMDPRPGLFGSEFLSYVQKGRETYDRNRRINPITFAAFRQSPWYHYGILSLEQTQLTVRSPFLDNDFVQTVYRAPAFAGGTDEFRLRMIRDGSETLGQIRSDRGVGGPARMTSAATRAFLEFTFKAEYAYDYGMPQPVARIDHAFSALHLERLFLGRHKFLHYRLWYRDFLSSYVKQMLLDPRTLARPYIERKTLEGIVSGHLKGDRNYTTDIHKLLTLELLNRLFFDPK